MARRPARAPQLVTEIQRATHVLGLHLEELLADLALTQGEIHVLALLTDTSPITVSELQAGVRHRPSTLTGIIDRLEARRLVRRLVNEDDRRSFLIELTAAGRLAGRRVARAMAAVETRVSKGRPPAELAATRRVLERIATDG